MLSSTLLNPIYRWAVKDPTFDPDAHLYMDAAHLKAADDSRGITLADIVTLGTNRIGDIVDGQSAAPDEAKTRGVKILMWTGTSDPNIASRGSIDYYRRVAEHFGRGDADYATLAPWFRLFLAPGVVHCSADGVGPFPQELFRVLTNWVENDVAPYRILAKGGAVADRTRPLCPFPKTAIYKGSGSTDNWQNFSCGGNLETAAVSANDRRAEWKHENGTGKVPAPYGPP
jgi:hypothetical protein